MILSDDEIAVICADSALVTPCDIYYARAIEAKVLEKLSDEYAMRLQSDLEHGVKFINIAAHEKFNREYPQLAGFLDWLAEKEMK